MGLHRCHWEHLTITGFHRCNCWQNLACRTFITVMMKAEFVGGKLAARKQTPGYLFTCKLIMIWKSVRHMTRGSHGDVSTKLFRVELHFGTFIRSWRLVLNDHPGIVLSYHPNVDPASFQQGLQLERRGHAGSCSWPKETQNWGNYPLTVLSFLQSTHMPCLCVLSLVSLTLALKAPV